MNIKDKATEIFDITAEPAANLLASVFLNGVVGSLVPGAVSTLMAYRQKRSEKMFEAFMIECNNRQDDFEKKLKEFDERTLRWFQNTAFPLVSDYVLNCNQEDKIEYLVTGFINVAKNPHMHENTILFYYDLLDRLSFLELIILKNKSQLYKDDSAVYQKYVDKEMIFDGTFENINHKLESMSLVETREGKSYREVINSIVQLYDYIKDLNRNTNRKITLPKTKLKKSSFTSYVLTKTGRRFISFFCE